MISVCFFGEKLPEDVSTRYEIDGSGGGCGGLPGTAMGEGIHSATFGVKVLNWYDSPLATWKIPAKTTVAL